MDPIIRGYIVGSGNGYGSIHCANKCRRKGSER